MKTKNDKLEKLEAKARWAWDWAKNHEPIVMCVLAVLFALNMGGCIARAVSNKRVTINPFINIFYGLFGAQGMLFSMAFAVIALSCCFVWKKLGKQNHGDRDLLGRFYLSTEGSQGTAHFATKEELEIAQVMGKIRLYDRLEDINGVLLGKAYDQYLALPDQSDSNHNIMAYGSQGSKKTTSLVIWQIYAEINMGHSIITTDPKGESYKRTSKYAREKGYTVRVLNTVNFQHSDGWDLMESLNGVEDIMKVANTMLRTVKGNERWDSYYDDNELNVLQAFMEYVYYSNPSGKRTFTDVYEMLTENDLQEIQAIFNLLRASDRHHPANIPWNSVKSAEKSLPGFLSGLQGKLSFFQNEYLQEVMRHDEIDLELPAKEKCIYYLVIDESNKRFQPIVAVFINLLISKIFNYAKRSEKLQVDVPVTLLLEEMPNIGVIDGIEDMVGTARGFGIAFSMLAQNIPQMQEKYVGNAGKLWENLFAGCDYRTIYGTNDETTAKYFSGLLDVCTTENINIRRSGSAMQFTDKRLDYLETKADGGRNLMNPDEIMGLDGLVRKSSYKYKKEDGEYGILLIRGVPPILIEKIMYYKTFLKDVLEEELITEHTPSWMESFTPRSTMYGKRVEMREQRQKEKGKVSSCTKRGKDDEDYVKSPVNGRKSAGPGMAPQPANQVGEKLGNAEETDPESEGKYGSTLKDVLGK